MSVAAILGNITCVQDFLSAWSNLNLPAPTLLLLTKCGDSEFISKHLSQVFGCATKLIESNGHLIVKSIFVLKTNADLLRVNEVIILCPQTLEKAVTDAFDLLFMPSYNARLLPFQCLHFNVDLTDDKTMHERVQMFLEAVPSCNGQVRILKSAVIPDAFNHGFSLRYGGLSSYPDQSSLNLCYSDRKKDSKLLITENRARLALAAGFNKGEFYVAKAVHGKDVWVYEKDPPESYDAVITNTKKVTVAAPGADCNILLFADPVAKACAAAHAGWKGILKGIIQSTVQAMVDNYGSNVGDIKVCVGPSLSVCCCEFGNDGVEKFSPISKDCVVWKETSSKPYIDLRLAAHVLLENEGIQPQNIEDGFNSVSDLQICTKCDPQKRFFSYRRDGSQFGNAVGFIGLR